MQYEEEQHSLLKLAALLEANGELIARLAGIVLGRFVLHTAVHTVAHGITNVPQCCVKHALRLGLMVQSVPFSTQSGKTSPKLPSKYR